MPGSRCLANHILLEPTSGLSNKQAWMYAIKLPGSLVDDCEPSTRLDRMQIVPMQAFAKLQQAQTFALGCLAKWLPQQDPPLAATSPSGADTAAPCTSTRRRFLKQVPFLQQFSS